MKFKKCNKSLTLFDCTPRSLPDSVRIPSSGWWGITFLVTPKFRYESCHFRGNLHRVFWEITSLQLPKLIHNSAYVADPDTSSGVVSHAMITCMWSYVARDCKQPAGFWSQIRNFSILWVLVVNCLDVFGYLCAEIHVLAIITTKPQHHESVYLTKRSTLRTKCRLKSKWFCEQKHLMSSNPGSYRVSYLRAQTRYSILGT